MTRYRLSHRRLLMKLSTVVAALAAFAVFASSAGASSTPTLTLDQSAGTQAGADQNLGLNISFSNSSTGLTTTDTPETLAITLPRGLIASAAAMTGGSPNIPCVQWSGSGTPPSNCIVGTGTAGATAIVALLPVDTTVPLTYYLVAPPAGSGALAGLDVFGGTPSGLAGIVGNVGQLGSTGTVSVSQNVSSLNISLGLPDTVSGLSSEITSVDSIFNGIRYPTTCPSTPEQVSVTSTSYDDSTPVSSSANLNVTGCSSLPYNPQYALSVTKDSSDSVVGLTSTITQAADEAPSSSIGLNFPTAALDPSFGVLEDYCSAASLAASTCTAVGSATASSPLYPTPLTGQAYLTGNTTASTVGDTGLLTGLSLTLVFPAPFPITLTGTVDLANNAVDFAGLPDIPLSSLAVTLNGGPQGAYQATCDPASGTSTTAMTDQNGDETASPSSAFTVQGCPASSAAAVAATSGSSTGSAATASGSGSSVTTKAKAKVAGTPRLSGARFSGLNKGKAAAAFTVKAGSNAPALRQLSIKLPSGLKFHVRRVHGKPELAGVELSGAKAKLVAVIGGRLVIVLKAPSRALTVKLGSSALIESSKLIAQSKHRKLGSLRLNVTVVDSSAHSTALHAQVR